MLNTIPHVSIVQMVLLMGMFNSLHNDSDYNVTFLERCLYDVDGKSYFPRMYIFFSGIKDTDYNQRILPYKAIRGGLIHKLCAARL